MNEPTWLTQQMVLSIHEDLISQYGGLSGVRQHLHLCCLGEKFDLIAVSPTCKNMVNNCVKN